MRRAFLWLISLAGLAYCSSPAAPPPTLLLETPYTLHSINGKPLPYSLCAPNDPCGSAYLALTLTFHRDLTLDYDQTSTSPSVQGPISVSYSLGYDHYQSHVTIFYGSTEIGALTYSDSGTLLNRELLLSAKRVGGRYQMNFTAR